MLIPLPRKVFSQIATGSLLHLQHLFSNVSLSECQSNIADCAPFHLGPSYPTFWHYFSPLHLPAPNTCYIPLTWVPSKFYPCCTPGTLPGPRSVPSNVTDAESHAPFTASPNFQQPVPASAQGLPRALERSFASLCRTARSARNNTSSEQPSTNVTQEVRCKSTPVP